MATFGNLNYDRTSDVNLGADGTAIGIFQLYNPGGMARVSKLTVLMQAATGTPSVKGLLYSDNAGEPQTLLATTDVVSPSTGGHLWYDLSFSSQPLIGDGYYWLGIVASANTIDFGRTLPPPTQVARIDTTSYSSPFATWDTAGDSPATESYMIYATYQPEPIPSAWLTG